MTRATGDRQFVFLNGRPIDLPKVELFLGFARAKSPAPDGTGVVPVLTIQAMTADEQARERDLQELGKLHNEPLQAYVCD